MNPQRTKVLIVGAGRVGLSLADMLIDADGYEVLLADCTEEAVSEARAAGHKAEHADAARPEQIRQMLAGADVLVAAVPDRLVPALARAAADAGVHYLDFSEASSETQASAENQPADRAFLPSCGVSPGLVDTIANDLVRKLDPGCDLDVRVGAIPARRTNRLGYGLTWNLEGLIAEYTEPCSAIIAGKPVHLPALSGLVEFKMDGVDYEAFHTAGSVKALQALVAPRVGNMTLRTIRYPGHLDYMQFLLDDLDLKSRHYLLSTLLRNGLPVDDADALIIRVFASGNRGGQAAQEEFSCRIETEAGPAGHGALAVASAAHAATLIDLLCRKELDGNQLRNPALVPHADVFASRHFSRLSQRILQAA